MELDRRSKFVTPPRCKFVELQKIVNLHKSKDFLFEVFFSFLFGTFSCILAELLILGIDFKFSFLLL